MALTLRDSMAPALQLRDQPSIVDQGLAFEQYQAGDSNPVLRGWRSAGLGSKANSLFSEANAAERRGDMLAAQAFERQAQDTLRRSQVWAPTTQEFSKIDGLRSAGSWLGGQVGNLRTSVPPLVGGVVGGLGGAALGTLVGGPAGGALGARLGSAAGAGLMGYNMEYDEAVGNAMMDPQIRATRSADDIHTASQVKAAVAGGFESVVPAGVAKAALLGVGKKVVGESLKRGIGKAAAIDAATEAMTEAAQELTGQSTQNYLRGEDLTNWDAEQAFNAAMGGAVGGAVMGAGGHAAGSARDYLANREPKEKRDLTGRLIDAYVNHSEKKGRKQAQQEIAAMNEEDILKNLFTKRTPHITDPISDEESKLSDEEIGKSRRALAEQHALEVVKAPAGMYPAEEVQAANEFLTGQAKDWMKLRDASRASRADKKAQDDAEALMKAAGLKDETKNSLMSPTLTDDFGEQEGRSMDDDFVTDDQGNVVRRSDTRQMSLPNDERGFGSTVRRVTGLQKSWDKGATKEQAERTVTLADVLVNGGYWPKDIVDSAKTTTQKEAQLTTASTLLTWLKYGMMRDRKVKGGDTENVIEHLVGRYGKSGVDMLSKAYEVGVNAGLFERNDEMFAERRAEAEQLLADEKNHGDLIMANISPEFKREVRSKEDLAHLVREVRRMAGAVSAQANPEHSAELYDATDTASPSRVDQRVLERLFPNAENRHKVLTALYSSSKSAFGAESKASQPVKETDGTGRAQKSFEVDERSTMEAEDEEDAPPATTQNVEYVNRKKGHPYSKKDPEHRAQLAKDRKEAQADGYRVEEIGAIDRALEVARRNKGEALSADETFSVTEKEVKRHTRKGLDRPTEPPANASDVSKRLYTEDLKRYKQRVQRAARGVNNRFVYIKRTETKDAPLSSDIDLEAILSNARDVDISDPRNGIGNGTMWFRKSTGGTLIINAPQITRLMFQRTENDGGLNHTVGTGEEKRELTKGGPQNVLELFHEGVASILSHDLFTGEFGYVHAGKAVPLKGVSRFPDDFKLSKNVTYGQGKASQKSFASQIEGNEFDQEEMSQPTHRMQATMWQKFLALKGFAKKGVGAEEEQMQRLQRFIVNVQANIDENRKKGAKGDDLISRRNHVFLGKWMAALGLEAGTINVAEAGTEQTRAKDGLQAYDPDKSIVRGKNGMAETGDNIEMAAASLIGRSKRGTAPVAERKVGEKIVDTPIVERVEDQGGVPTAKTPGRTSTGLTDTQLEAGKQRFVELMRESVDAVISAISTMSQKEVTLFETAFADFSKLSSTNVAALAKGYFKGDENAARMFTTRLARSNVLIGKAINAREAEVKNGQLQGSKEEAFGEGRQADTGRTEARVAARDNGQRAAAPSADGAGQPQRTANRAADGRGLLNKLKSAKPKNEFHRRAINKVIAILEGGAGKLVDALNTMMRWDQTLGDLSPRQREALKSAVEARGEKFEDVPIEAYDDERMTDFDEADIEADRAAFEGDGETKYSLMSTEIHNSLGKEGFAATHDSPIRHEGKFDWRAHQGKGEGNAAFGAGTYLSTADGVHRNYKSQFTAVTQGGAFTQSVSANQDVRDYLYDLAAELRQDSVTDGAAVKEAVVDGLREQMREYDEGSSEKEAYGDAYFRARDMVASDFVLGSGGVSPTYHVTVNIKQDELLDWDAPLYNQFDLPKSAIDAAVKVFTKKAYEKALREGEDTVYMGRYTVRVHTGKIVGIGHEYGDFLDKSDPDFDEVVRKAARSTMTGQELYTGLANELGSQAKASDYLQSLGILGHVYDAAGGEEENFRNYVVYDDSKIETNYVHFSKKSAKGKVSTPEEQAVVKEQLHKLLGKDVKILFENLGGKSGSWTPEQTMNVIRIAINADITSTGFHESMHQLLYLLKQAGADGAKVVAQLERAAMSPIMQQRLRTMLKDHPKAMTQLTDPEEAISYMFQFWMMDQSGFKIGPETRTLFEKVKDFLRSAAALFSKTIRTELLKEKASRIDAEATLRVLNDLAGGKMAEPNERPSAIKVMAEYTGKRDEAIQHLGEGYKKLLQGFGKYLATNEGLLESYNNRHLTRLARLFNQRAGEAQRQGSSFFDERDFRINKMMNKWEKVAQKYSKEDLEIARAWMSTEQGQAHPDAGINSIVKDVKGILDEMKAYIAERDIKRLEPNPVTGKMEWKSIDFRKHYWPRIWDASLVNTHKEEILEKLLAYPEVANIAKSATEEAVKQGKPEVTKEDVALQIFSRMLGGTSQVELSEELSDLGMTPVATAVNRRSLEWLDMHEFDKYVSKDMNNIMSAYIRNIIKRGEYQHRFGPGGEFLKELVDSAILTELGGEKLLNDAVLSLEPAQKAWGRAKAAAEQAGKKFDKEFPTTRSVGLAIYRSQNGDKAAEKIDATMKRLEPAFQAIMALEGTLGSDIDPTLRNVSSWVTTYQNYRLLMPGIFSSFMDVMGVVREGGELSDAWGAFVAGIKEIRNTWTNEKGRDYMMERAELFGSADAGSYASTIGEANGSVYMSEGARKWSDRLFKWNGMEGWNRGMRAYATSVAERILLDWQKNGIDTKDKAAVARVERLFGKGFDVKNIAVEADGTLDIKDARNIAAVNRWVLDAVIRPNAAHRPVMASDPHMQVFYHLKNFTYSMHAVMLKNVAAQARLGNYRPAMVTLVGYAPIAIAAGAVKELLIPGDEPPWLKNGLVGYLGYGWDRAGVLGIPQMYASNLFDPAQNFGPSAGQLQDLVTIPFGEFKVGPAGWNDHRVFEEMLGAAPFGTVLKRIGKNVDDIIEGK